MTSPDPASVQGTFEYIEAKIRRDAKGTAFGGDFEWLCQWFLKNAPRYRGQFDKVWLWKDWPERWGTDAGIDIVAVTRAGELWAIQAKADHPDRAIPKREIDSFLSESNRRQFAYRLLMATTDDVGATARRTLHGQEKPVGLVLRGHFLTEEVQWPIQIGGTAARLPRWKARPHQATAIEAVVNGFRDHDRGRLVMACGTGKTLTALWLAERLRQRRLPKSPRLRKSVEGSLTLVLVPSLSLVQQNLAEWGRHSAEDFDTLVVCSDESVLQGQADTAIQSTADLGVKVTTAPSEIRHFLAQRRKRPAVVFATYQSSDRIAAAQAGKAKPFDLAICDEAHRLAGHAEGLFATVLDDKKIKASKRLFMTATPRYFKEHVKRRAAELEFELVSMDDAHVFGPEFHVLTFHEAISAKPEPLLTDYQVVVIGVTDREAKAWAERATLVRIPARRGSEPARRGPPVPAETPDRRSPLHASQDSRTQTGDLRSDHSAGSGDPRTAQDFTTDARTLAAQIGLAKAMRKYDLRKLITFHSSVAKAARFVDATRRDSLPGVIPHLTRSTRPSGKLWTKHISGHTPAGQRATLLKGLGNLPDDTRGILSNCACLGEGVDVPVLDGVAFIDPKRSMVDIIQAVGRVIRKAEGKQIGTIVIPVFIDETEDADHILSQSAFKPVWQVLNALRAHDRRLADQLDQLRLSLGRRRKSGGKVKLPPKIYFDVPKLVLHSFEQAFYIRTVEKTTDKPALTIEQILAWADAHHDRAKEWPREDTGPVYEMPCETWLNISQALRLGLRQLLRGGSLAKLLADKRGVRNRLALANFTKEQILEWADTHHKRTGLWPQTKSGPVVDVPGESWPALDDTLRRGARGLPGGSSLAQLLTEERDVPNQADKAPLTNEQILLWADAHYKLMGEWPKVSSGRVHEAPKEKWMNIHAALYDGGRGLPGGSSLAQLLAEKRGLRNSAVLPPLTKDKILAWADAHHEVTGQWPKTTSGSIYGTLEETWNNIDAAMRNGGRGLPDRSSLAQLLAEERGVPNRLSLAPLNQDQILAWADSHYQRTGKWPKQKSGPVSEAPGVTWQNIDTTLRVGRRGFPGGSSLAQLLAENRNVRNQANTPQLSTERILTWADAHKARTGKWPKRTSGPVNGVPDETWARINQALVKGHRGLPGGSSLTDLLGQERGVRNHLDLPRLTEEQILTWADAHKRRTGDWPNQNSGPILDAPGENWKNINESLRIGRRSLPGGSSLTRLVKENRESWGVDV